MSIYFCKKTRRQFLVGTGKSLLLLPLLPSLAPINALAQSASAQSRRMMLFWFDHNNLSELWPGLPNLSSDNAVIPASFNTTPVGSSGAREVLLRNLGAAGSISPVFGHQAWQTLNQNNQLTILRGLDTSVAYGPGHGNFTMAAAQGRHSEGGHPTIDTFVEASSSVYSATTPSNVLRAVRIQPGSGSLFYRRVGSGVQVLPGFQSNIGDFYNQVFGSITGGTTPPPSTGNQMKSNILNKTHSAFQSFRNSRRISSDDRARLDQHIGYLTDLQRSFQSIQTNSCSAPAAPGNISGNPEQYYAVYMRLMAIAFKCGLTKFGTMCFEAHDPQWLPNLNIQNFHDAIHGDQGSTIQRQAFERWWTYFANLIAENFIEPMSEMEGSTGQSYLSNMITGMICAGGVENLAGYNRGHSGLDSQQILIGNMGGALRSGRYYALPRNGGHRHLPYNCFLITLLQLMGVPAAEYSAYAANQQGLGYYGDFPSNHPLRSRFSQPITEVLT